MSLTVPNIGDVLMLKYIVNQLNQDGSHGGSGGQRLLKLFTNNMTPAKGDSLGSYVEASQAGYAGITLSGANWTVWNVTDLGNPTGTNVATYASQTFSFSTAVTCYGYFVTTLGVSPSLLWAERFSTAPFTLPSGGGEIAITPQLTLD